MEKSIVNLMLIDENSKQLKCKIVKGCGIFFETAQFIGKNNLITKIIERSPQSTRLVFNDNDWGV